MDMKKDLIEERDAIIKNETYRYVTLFENKSEEVKVSPSFKFRSKSWKTRQMNVTKKKNKF